MSLDWVDTADDARYVFSQPERADVDHPGVVASGDGELTGEWGVAYERSLIRLRMTVAQMVGDEILLDELADMYTALEAGQS